MRGQETDPGDRAAHGDHGRDEQHGDGERGQPGAPYPYAERPRVVVAEPQDAEDGRAQDQRGDGGREPRPQSVTSSQVRADRLPSR
ncbi:hypothetical protein GCM10023237_12140 [Streptomyces coeruleoprunus]